MFDPSAYGTQVAEILALDGNGFRLMPLAHGTCSSAEALKRLKAATARQLFAGSRAPEAAMAGLYLYFSCLDESHTISQTVETPDGSFWHGIMHRQEPDPGNSAYWFRRVARHPIFPALSPAAGELGYYADLAPGAASFPDWDPFRFINFCEEGNRDPESSQGRLALAIQLAEWQLLFDHCAAKR